jgi:molybdopterin molybdotransferase
VTYSFEQARECVISRVSASARRPPIENVGIEHAFGRVLAESVQADRDYPPFPRSARDGFAVRASDTPARLEVIGEVRAGESPKDTVVAGTAVEIMTGAPVPEGADAVIMVEHLTRDGTSVVVDRNMKSGDNISPAASEMQGGSVVLEPGARIGYRHLALLATVGRTSVAVYRRPRVAIVATGDELVEITDTPLNHQIRNSNAVSVAAQVAAAGGEPHILGIARDTLESTRALIADGITYDLLLLSGGVSAGKYDVVETVLAEFGAEFFFTRVLIQPGQPLVFGTVKNCFFFGLPGNPASTMVTFEVFARAAVELLAGQTETVLPILWSKLTRDFRQKRGLTRFLPALLTADGAALAPVPWHGSADVRAVASGNALLVTEPDREEWAAGDWMRVLAR